MFLTYFKYLVRRDTGHGITKAVTCHTVTGSLGLVLVVFVMYKVALGQVLIGVFQFSPVIPLSVIPPILRTH